MAEDYYRVVDGEKVYYIDNKKVGTEYDVVKLLIGKGMSSSKAHKKITKIKENKNNDVIYAK